MYSLQFWLGSPSHISLQPGWIQRHSRGHGEGVNGGRCSHSVSQAFFSTLFRRPTCNRFAVEVAFLDFRPEFFQDRPEFLRFLTWVSKNVVKMSRHFAEIGFLLKFFPWILRSTSPFQFLGPEFSPKPEFFVDLSFSPNVKKSLRSYTWI